MRGRPPDYCATCKQQVVDGFEHLRENPTHKVYDNKSSALKAQPPVAEVKTP